MNSIDPNFAWGPRDWLYKNRFDYMFSLEAEFEMCVDPVRGEKVPLKALQSTAYEWNTFHVLGQEFIRAPNGVQQEVPRARLVFGTDALLIQDEGVVSVNGSLLFETDTPDRLSMCYRGVFDIPGGTRRLCSPPLAEGDVGPSGTAYISSVQDMANPKYRWMILNQLIGVGRVEARGEDRPDPDHALTRRRTWILKVDYDLYIAS
jgi:hypothetical protein